LEVTLTLAQGKVQQRTTDGLAQMQIYKSVEDVWLFEELKWGDMWGYKGHSDLFLLWRFHYGKKNTAWAYDL